MVQAALILVLLAGVVSCGEAQVETTFETRSFALGEPVGDYPSLAERQLLYLSNRARTEPDAFNPDDVYPPTPPLRWDYRLSVAARFHAGHILDASCWCEDHSSCCTLDGEGEDVACASAASGCGVTSASDRVSLFSPSYGGENMAMGQMTPEAAIEGWIFSPGHWENMNRPGFSLLGPGAASTAWVQDFGVGGGAPPTIGDGIHLSNGQATTFGITYYQPGTDGPRTALVIVNGECHELSVAYGTAEAGAFETSVNLTDDCNRYYFHFTDGNGNDTTYPSAGSLGVGKAECPLYVQERPADTCSPSGQSCMTGDVRSCYTGPFGTRDIGVCSAGSERCIAGQWTGECNNESHPESAEICDNMADDNCDGEVDEGCAPDDDGASKPDMGLDDTDNEEKNTATSSKSDSGGCSMITADNKREPVGLLLVALVATIWRRRRTRP